VPRERWAQPIAYFVLSIGVSGAAFGADPPVVPAPPPNPPSAVDTWGVAETEVETPAPAAPVPPVPAPTPVPALTPRSAVPDASDGESSFRTPALRYTLEAIEVRGNTRTSQRVVLRYLPFERGAIFDVDDSKVQLARFRLLGTGFFRDVQFSLRKGSARGLVVLVVDVVERNTIVVNDISMGLSADADTGGDTRPLTAYGGLDVAETNLGGTGITLGTAAAVAEQQLALRVRFLDPALLGGPWMTSGTLLFNNAKDYFGISRVFTADPESNERNVRVAVVRYKRFGGSLGLGRDLSITTQLWFHYRLEAIDAVYPLQASHIRGTREPIDFHVVRGRSVLSTLGATLQHDTRDHPVLPTRGWFLSFRGELSLLPAALDYEYQRFELDVSRWWRMPPRGHVLKLNLFAGGISGNAPFFEQFHVGDFSDFRPDRVLGINFDRRPPPNLLGTEIAEVRYGQFAFKLNAEYRIPLYRGRRSVFGIDVFGSAGIYGVAGRRDLTDPPAAYSGLARAPVDLTGNLGFRMDTSAGGFVFAFSNILGFIPVGEGPAGE
jgi:outer membrane protein assembly factor BamA